VNGTSGTALAISAGDYHSCAVQSGTFAVVCWGANFDGQAAPPPEVDGTTGGAAAIAAGGNLTLAIAVPEPGFAVSLASGIALLAALHSRRKHPPGR
jgi:hypothetical protein